MNVLRIKTYKSGTGNIHFQVPYTHKLLNIDVFVYDFWSKTNNKTTDL